MNWNRRQTKSASEHIRRVYASRSDARLTDLGIPLVPLGVTITRVIAL